MKDETPAFPCSSVCRDSRDNLYETFQTGMTLRDWFAGMALQGLIENAYTPLDDGIAETAYKIANAMMKARGK